MDLIARKAGPGDAEGMARLFYDTVHAVNSRDYGPEQIEAWAPRLLSADEWRARQGDKIVTVALEGDRLVGFAELEPDGHIDGFYVHKDRQRRGVGSRLMVELETAARQRGELRLYADVSLSAQAFFRSRGFALVQEREVERRGVRLKNARMEKRLRAPGYMTEDLQPREVAGPPRYRSRTEKAVECIALADPRGVVIGYLYANDEDDAAGWQAHPEAGVEAQNLAAPWVRRLRDAKRRGLRPTEALDELVRDGSDEHSHVVPGSRRSLSGLSAL